MLRISLVLFTALFILTSCGGNGQAPSDTPADSTAAADSSAAPEVTYERYWNDYARFLAGLDPLAGSELAGIDDTELASQHRAWFDKEWERKENRMLGQFRTWAAQELGAAHTATRTVFYPFSGPDFVHLNALYPNSSRYVLYALEPEGRLPDLRGLPIDRLTYNVRNLQQSLHTVLPISFYRTNDMKEDFDDDIELFGTAPTLLAFLARTGHEVLNVQHVMIDTSTSELVRLDSSLEQSAYDPIVTGIEYTFRKPGGEVQTLEFYSQDVSDGKFEEVPAFQKYLRALGPTNSFVKSASYLMHKEYFSTSRNILLEVSQVLVQDDSGVPVRFFEDGWQLQFYGVYTRPIQLFANWYQPKMTNYYATTDVRELAFGIGYQYQPGTSNLMIARKQ